ncbi:hypothetical protein RAS1_14980 [Phycisphaerae bacterium RAS1]|nr:hypothetical protein RAS1_14980 [Phycisphaerae bacterium RAS1]
MSTLRRNVVHREVLRNAGSKPDDPIYRTPSSFCRLIQ